MFLFVFIICFIFTINNSFAEVLFILPDDMEMEEVNKNMKKKTMNRNVNVYEQMNNQYKGKLKYKPLKNERKASKKKRFFTSVYYSAVNLKIEEIKDNTSKNTYDMKRDDFKDSYGAKIGIYFKNNMGLSLEYFDYSNTIKSKNYFFIDSRYTWHKKVDMDIKNYFLNYFLENNYARVIPFLGFGGGVVTTSFKNSELNKNYIGIKTSDYKTRLKKDWTFGYQIFAGFEFLVTESCFLFAEYRFYGLKDNPNMRVINMYNENDYDFKLKNNSFINVGFKYLW